MAPPQEVDPRDGHSVQQERHRAVEDPDRSGSREAVTAGAHRFRLLHEVEFPQPDGDECCREQRRRVRAEAEIAERVSRGVAARSRGPYSMQESSARGGTAPPAETAMQSATTPVERSKAFMKPTAMSPCPARLMAKAN
jgi:hypothetical protein